MAIPRDLRVHRPETVDEALALLDELGDDAAPYAGGTELVMLLKLGLTSVRDLVDVRRIPLLQGIRLLDHGALRVGAATTHRELHQCALASRWPSLPEMEATVGNVRVMSMGTLGGNLCFADPQSDPATYLTAVAATLVCTAADGSARRLPVQDFLLDAYSTSLRHGTELLASIEIPPLDDGCVIAHRKIAFGERPDVTCALRLRARDGYAEQVCLVLGSMTGRPLVTDAGRQLERSRLADLVTGSALVRDVAQAAADEAHAVALTDSRGRHARVLAVNLVEQVVAVATDRLDAGAVVP
ncbi:MAG: hypothetical protein GEU93_17275 [Propionibacteriales bacterium]|nr:hypothetical protein [Propionibacteriales bacterium]